MEKKKLKTGILLNDYFISAWSYKMLEKIADSHFAEISLVILNGREKVRINTTVISKIKNNRGRLSYLFVRRILELLYQKLIERNTYIPKSGELVDCRGLLKNVPVIRVNTERKKWSDYFSSKDIEEIRKHDLDVLVRNGFGILRGDILTAAKVGVWSFHHGDNCINRGGPACFWESMASWPETGSILQILTEDLDNGKVLWVYADSCG